MSIFTDYIYGFFGYNTQTYDDDIDTIDIIEPNKVLITVNDLLKVNLSPMDNIKPQPARNMPPVRIGTLQDLSRDQLKEIRTIRKNLRRVLPPQVDRKYPPRHPVLKEFLEKHAHAECV